MMVFSAQLAEGVGCIPTPFHSIYPPSTQLDYATPSPSKPAKESYLYWSRSHETNNFLDVSGHNREFSGLRFPYTTLIYKALSSHFCGGGGSKPLVEVKGGGTLKAFVPITSKNSASVPVLTDETISYYKVCWVVHPLPPSPSWQEEQWVGHLEDNYH